jgi:hypothetical protein
VEVERVTADGEAQDGAVEQGCRGRYEQRELRWMGARAKEIRMMGEYRGDKDDSALLFFNFLGPQNDDPVCSAFQIFGFIIGVDRLKRQTQKILIFCISWLRRCTPKICFYY